MATNSDSPGHIRGIFQTSLSVTDVRGWRDWIENNSKGALDFGLDEVTLCKCKGGKEHEFLLLRFRWKTTSKVAFVTADRVPAETTTAQDNSRNAHHSSILSTPSINSTPANDIVHIIPENEDHQKEVSKIYHSYNKLCTLEFLSFDARPSPLQASALLDVVIRHAPIYDLFEKQCYWFSNTVFDALLKLFPSGKEICSNHERRGHYSILNIAKQDSVDVVCEEYIVEWQKEQDKRKIEEDKKIEAEEKNRRVQEERDRFKAELQKKEIEAVQYKAKQVQLIGEVTRSNERAARADEEVARSNERAAQSDEEAARSNERATQSDKEAARFKAEADQLRAQLAAALGQGANKGLEHAVAAN